MSEKPQFGWLRTKWPERRWCRHCKAVLYIRKGEYICAWNCPQTGMGTAR